MKNQEYEGFQNNDETMCKYVSSHGIKKSCEKLDNIYYINSDELENFIIPDKGFILVTNDSDRTIQSDILKANEILNSSHCIRWFTQNIGNTHEKLSAIPIGLDYHSITNEVRPDWGAKESPLEQEEYLLKLNKPLFQNREPKIYCNFKNSIRGTFANDRKESLEQISPNLLVIEEKNILRKDTWNNSIKYAFILSPHGNGLDCHRTWEALALGCIPIVKTSSLNVLYDELPVLIVNKWSDINEELLENTITQFKSMNFNYDKLKLSYWIKKISNTNPSIRK